MKIGIDIHNVITRYPSVFRDWSQEWVSDGGEVHIVTGQEWEKAQKTVDEHGIAYTHHYSIVDFHHSCFTEMHKADDGTWWMDKDVWNKSKGEYASRVGLDVHFDDDYIYGAYFPEKCTFVHVGVNFPVFMYTMGRALR